MMSSTDSLLVTIPQYFSSKFSRIKATLRLIQIAKLSKDRQKLLEVEH